MPSINRTKNYQKLRRAGFTSVEANRFKDYSDMYIDKLVRLQKLHKEAIKKELQEIGVKYHGEKYEF